MITPKKEIMRKIGFVINPVAGMGGRVALKGTDGMADAAVSLGAEPMAYKRAKVFLEALDTHKLRREGAEFLTAGGDMGENALRISGTENIRIVHIPEEKSSADDTKESCRQFKKEGADLIVFCGGDGTAQDVISVTGEEIPVLGIPSGVKMYSGIFARSPAAAANIINNPEKTAYISAEVLDIDEDKYRAGKLELKLFGIAKTPTIPDMTQSSKMPSSGNEKDAQNEISGFLTSLFARKTLCLIGAGSTAKSLCSSAEGECTLLGVDAMYEGEIIKRDLSEKDILELLDEYERVKIIVSPIGAQGFIFGRGNQQFSPEVLKKAGSRNVIVIATPAKLEMTPRLYIDTGDSYADNSFGESIQVICGYAAARRIPLIH
ncbi:ATP-NAD kinase family protein [Methanoplanus endosymbiosus]|uniref:ATP-NAD kinase family protein n=1 Tax=Methanoplanus endosymbiosus TaxID=33865 RepID=A0A9E7TJL8_9EURY|nr:ATP-NAD kinase family protein [Methanoplanus endosymbiosus]UUX93793.1 ATP-NAD kinase family protein [Methanoplanus endosymbiosus]